MACQFAPARNHLIVIPDKNMVIVHLARENQFGRGGVGTRDFWNLYQKIMAASPKP